MALVENLQKLIRSFAKSKGFDRLLQGAQVLSANDGKVRVEMMVKPEHLNVPGTMHGGLICTLVDTISTLAIASTKDNKFGVSVDLNVSFISAASPGEKIVIESEVLRTGKNLAFANVNILKEDGKLVATGRHTKYLGLGNVPDARTFK
ncbi:acyl-coenzyme A thioesterase 13-like [Styela clava]|uniref:acyl-coenzyme A thioesterase 13-like n=1 Tax=Styela clava TaxID=7725 RepID=UPI00193A3970|nr:acyl-coenzyme A thioesterase 13-like [Styela clava]